MFSERFETRRQKRFEIVVDSRCFSMIVVMAALQIDLHEIGGWRYNNGFRTSNLDLNSQSIFKSIAPNF